MWRSSCLTASQVVPLQDDNAVLEATRPGYRKAVSLLSGTECFGS